MKKEQQIENFVCVPVGKPYTGGIGYTGTALRRLGLPTGPYVRKTADIVVHQTRPWIRLKVVEYKD